MKKLFLVVTIFWPLSVPASALISIMDFAPIGTHVDQTGKSDASIALSAAISAANAITALGSPACVYIPPGTYLVVHNPPEFARAGCVRGDGPTQSIITLDPNFKGDLFSWSEAWYPTTPGPRVVGIKIVGSKAAAGQQNALVFYDRNDEVYLSDIDIDDLPGRALYSGVTKHEKSAYMRESRILSLRLFRDGALGIPVVEFNSQGSGITDATNEIKISDMDIYGSRGPSFVIRNNGSGGVRNISADSMRIEGTENGTLGSDLVTIGDPTMKGSVAGIQFNNLELIDPYRGYAAMRLTAAPGSLAPYQIVVQGTIGGGVPHGEGLRIDAGRYSVFRMSSIHTEGTNVIIGPGVSQIVLEGGGAESCWTYRIDPSSATALRIPMLSVGNPSIPNKTLQEIKTIPPERGC